MKKDSKSKVKIIPLADRVLIKELESKEKNQTESGIYIPETVDSDKGAKKGEVVAIGEGRMEKGSMIPMRLKVGDEVLFQWGDKITLDGEEYYMVRESEVMAVIHPVK